MFTFSTHFWSRRWPWFNGTVILFPSWGIMLMQFAIKHVRLQRHLWWKFWIFLGIKVDIAFRSIIQACTVTMMMLPLGLRFEGRGKLWWVGIGDITYACMRLLIWHFCDARNASEVAQCLQDFHWSDAVIPFQKSECLLNRNSLYYTPLSIRDVTTRHTAFLTNASSKKCIVEHMVSDNLCHDKTYNSYLTFTWSLWRYRQGALNILFNIKRKKKTEMQT